MLDNVLAKRLAGVQLAFAQILDLLGDQLGIEPVVAGPHAAQQVRLLLRPGVEILVVKRTVSVSHVRQSTTTYPERWAEPMPIDGLPPEFSCRGLDGCHPKNEIRTLPTGA